MQELIEKRLSLFGQPQMFLLEEWDSQLPRTLDWWKVYENKILIKWNQEQPYSLNFAPNGNYQKVNHIEWRVSHTQKNAEQYISSMYVDIDMKDSSFKDLDKLFNATLETIWNDKIPVQFITKSWWWFHLWMFIEETQRYVIGERYTNKLSFMQESLADVFDWWCKESHWIQKLMRVPFSKYWKSKPSKSTSLLKVNRWENWITTSEVKTVDDIVIDSKWILTIERIESFYKNIQKIDVTTKKWDSPLGEIGTAQINTLSIVDVIDRLKKYPREYWGATYEYFLKGNRIQFRINWQLYIPDWYKVNRDTNYVHNFSMTSHPIFERPRWPVFPFLYNYFNKDITLVNKFLTDEYSISIVKGEGSEGMYLCIPTESGYIYFTDKGVFYGKSIFDKKKETYKDVQVKLFDIPIYVKWIIQTNYDLFGETDEKNFFYILYNQKSSEEIIIEFTPDRKAFNKKYGKKWLIFVWDEFDLLDFYNGINKATSIIKEYDLKYLNGYYEDCFIIWDTIYNKSFQPVNIEDTNMLLKTQTIAAIKWQTEVPLAVFGEKLRNVFSDRQAMTSMMAFLALFLWHKFWVPILQKYKQQVLIPWLFLSGTTKSWKTTMLTMLKNAAWMTYESRKYSIVSTSPQPLKQAATDDFVLHFEEFTGDVWEIKETIVRDILNKARSARGTSDGSNVYYIYRASVILDWEKLPKSESVANRCIVIPMFDNASDKIGTEKTISEMMGISFLEDLITQTYSYQPEDVLKLFKQSEQFLKNNWFSDRNLFLYSFLLTTNRMFNVFFDDELLVAFKDNISLHKEIDSQNSVLSNVLADLILKYRSTPTHKVMDKWWMISIPFTQDFKQQNKIMLMDCLKQYPNNIKHLWNTIFITIWMWTNDSPIDIDKKIYDIVIPYKSYFRTTY